MPRLIRLLLCITLPEYRKLPRLNLCSQVPGSQIHLQFGNIKVSNHPTELWKKLYFHEAALPSSRDD
jgi:hypothetical protein